MEEYNSAIRQKREKIMNIKDESIKKIYVVVPGGSSGGHETLHQLVSILNNMGKQAYAYYLVNKKNPSIPEKFSDYHIKIAKVIEDKEENILIVPEIHTDYLYRFKKIRKIIWWLSWDFYLATCDKLLRRHLKTFNKEKLNIWLSSAAKIIVKKIIGWDRTFQFGTDKNEIFHFYNCEYVKQELISRGVKEENTMYLCGPISDIYFSQEQELEKEDIIVYNPAKGYEYTKGIIELLKLERKDILIVPICNMTPAEIVEILKRAKVYIDFGFFPGPERIPREAVTMKCNIVTSLYGSAQNDIDVMVPRNHKFDIEIIQKEVIVKEILEMLDSYEKYVEEFEPYRKKVREQRNCIKKNIEKFFS